MGVGVLSPRVKQLGYEADHSTPPSAKVRKQWNCTFTHSNVFVGCIRTGLNVLHLFIHKSTASPHYPLGSIPIVDFVSQC
jgi:hypothetical protein